LAARAGFGRDALTDDFDFTEVFAGILEVFDEALAMTFSRRARKNRKARLHTNSRSHASRPKVILEAM